MAVAPKDVFAGQIDLLVRYADVCGQAYHRWEGESCADRSNVNVGSFLNDLSFGQNNQQHCLLGAADTYGLIGLIEHQDSCIERDLSTRLNGRGCDAGQCDR